tara:strand:- start:311 stop:859 length:549 start_codon:yes stop_codon:yes gene_type:complete
MNPTLAEDIMRKNSHRSAIVLATLLAWLLVTPDRASAPPAWAVSDATTVVVPVNVTNLHEDVIRLGTWVRFFDSEVSGMLGNPGKIVGGGNTISEPVNRSVVEDMQVVVYPSTQPNNESNIFNATHYRIELKLFTRADDESMQWCLPNEDRLGPNFSHCQESGFLMQTYEAQEGPMSDLVPQ